MTLFFLILIAMIICGFYEHQWNLIKERDASEKPIRLGSGEMFDKVAQYYDQTNSILSMGWHKQWKTVLVKELNVYGTERVLDLATGTGDVAIKLAHSMRENGKLYGSSPNIIGVDPSHQMLVMANRKISREKDIYEGYISLRKGDVDDLLSLLEEEANERGEKVADLMYDKVAISFGVRNFENRLESLQQVRAVSKSSNPNGKLSILEFVAPSPTGIFGFLNPIVSNFVYYGVPLIGTVLSQGRYDVYSHLRDSIFAFPTPEDFQSTLTEAGFAHCEHKDIFLGVVYMFTCSTYSPMPAPPNPGATSEATEGRTPVASTKRKRERVADEGAGLFDDDRFVEEL